jgi:hypothetical protein
MPSASGASSTLAERRRRFSIAPHRLALEATSVPLSTLPLLPLLLFLLWPARPAPLRRRRRGRWAAPGPWLLPRGVPASNGAQGRPRRAPPEPGARRGCLAAPPRCLGTHGSTHGRVGGVGWRPLGRRSARCGRRFGAWRARRCPGCSRARPVAPRAARSSGAAPHTGGPAAAARVMATAGANATAEATEAAKAKAAAAAAAAAAARQATHLRRRPPPPTPCCCAAPR